MPKARTESITARRTALEILNRVEQTGRTLDQVLEERAPEMLQNLSPADRRLVNAIVYGVLRWRRRLDRLIQEHANMPAARISPGIGNILRIAAFQISFLDRVPDFAVVDTSVELAKQTVSVKSGRFVNGLLRNLLRSRPLEMDALLPADPVHAMAIRLSFPDWLARRWVRRFGIEEAVRLCEALNWIPPLTVRTNTLRISRDDLKEMLGPDCEGVSTTPYAPEGLFFAAPSKPIDQLQAFCRGFFQVQDEAAQLVSRLLSPKPGETILDACSGMGGKTGHIGQLMNNTGAVFAADKQAHKLERLAAEMERLSISIVKTRRLDLDDPSPEGLPHSFDRILLDAPCSGTGVIRRNPDIKWVRAKQDLARFARRQLAYLCALADRVASGGMLVYAVCSMEPEETSQVVENFLKIHPEFAIVADVPDFNEKEAASPMDEKGFFVSLPHLHGMDGFFAVRMKRK
jgi:16S rRNA (cytosine967-C5)-methyltransferase